MTFYYGVDFYPEHWPRANWDEYAELMQQASFNVVRLAEFAWVLMEPVESHFVFDWLDDAIDVLHGHGLSVVLGTPTAAMPAWVKEKYPEVMASSDGRHRDAWGVRKNNCFSSGIYRRLSKGITLAMAEHYSSHPAVIGWQIDNEFDGPVCRCQTCVREFELFLQGKYRDLDHLNEAWGTRFWGQIYSTWDQIQAPTNVQHDNPSLCLDWQRFQTYLQVRFQSDQAAILHELCPRQFLTHNYMGTANRSNCYELAKKMSFASFDSYPGFPEWTSTDIDYGTGFGCDLTRGLKGKNFWIMETTAGPIGWSEFTRTPRPGEMRRMFYSHVAHGADGQLFFRWRTCTSGREQYWHGLLGHDGKAGRRYDEAKTIGAEIAKLAPFLAETTLEPAVAIVYDYDSRWATEFQPSFRGNDYLENLRRYYDAFRRAGVDVEVIQSSGDFSKYRVVVTPELYVLSDATAVRLANFVEDGGVLLADLRTGVKSESSLCHERTLPGLLSGALGIVIGEYEAVPSEYAVEGVGALAGEYTAHLYADWITPATAESLANYKPWHVQQFCAASRNKYGSGVGYYVGTVIRGEVFYDKLIAGVLADADIRPILKPAAGIEISVRTSPERSLLFAINHSEAERTIVLPRDLRDLLSNTSFAGQITLERFGVRVFELPK